MYAPSFSRDCLWDIYYEVQWNLDLRKISICKISYMYARHLFFCSRFLDWLHNYRTLFDLRNNYYYYFLNKTIFDLRKTNWGFLNGDLSALQLLRTHVQSFHIILFFSYWYFLRPHYLAGWGTTLRFDVFMMFVYSCCCLVITIVFFFLEVLFWFYLKVS